MAKQTSPLWSIDFEQADDTGSTLHHPLEPPPYWRSKSRSANCSQNALPPAASVLSQMRISDLGIGGLEKREYARQGSNLQPSASEAGADRRILAADGHFLREGQIMRC